METIPTILVAEDDEDDVFIMKRACLEAKIKANLHVVGSGDEAVDYLEGVGHFADRSRFPLPDLVFLDLKMPGLNGFEVLEWKKDRCNLQMPFIVLSSSPENRDLQKARQLGAACYLIKPPTKSMVLSCLNQFGLLGAG